jgi:nicotinamide riboside kinase
MNLLDGCNDNPQGKTVFVIGAASTGHRLLVRALKKTCDAPRHNEAWELGSDYNIMHCSLPWGLDHQWLDIDGCIEKYTNRYWILCTRDTTCSASGDTQQRWTEDERQRFKNLVARDIGKLLLSDEKTYIWSYETFMHLGGAYFQHLCKNFLDVKPQDVGQLIDGNKKYFK